MSPGGIRPVALAVAWRTAHNIFTNPAFLIPSTLFPLLNFVAFAGGLSRMADVPGFDYRPGYTTFQYAFVLLQSSAMGGAFSGFGVARDFEYGFARRLLLAAPRRAGIVLGYALGALCRWLFVAAVVTVVALAARMHVLGGPVDLLALVVLAALVNFAAALWSCGVAMRFRTIQAGPLMQTPIFLALFLAPVYVPVDLLAGWIRSVASANPMTTLLEAERSLLAGQPSGVAVAFLTAVALSLVFGTWALGGLRSAERAG